jgi:hypothetical protein
MKHGTGAVNFLTAAISQPRFSGSLFPSNQRSSQFIELAPDVSAFMSKSKPKHRINRHERPLLSVSTILILSGFLIGLTVGRSVGEDLSPYLLSCGLAGCLAFISLDLTAKLRTEEAQEEEQRQQEERLEKHVLSLSSIGFTLPPLHEESSSLSPDELREVLETVRQREVEEPVS